MSWWRRKMCCCRARHRLGVSSDSSHTPSGSGDGSGDGMENGGMASPLPPAGTRRPPPTRRTHRISRGAGGGGGAGGGATPDFDSVYAAVPPLPPQAFALVAAGGGNRSPLPLPVLRTGDALPAAQPHSSTLRGGGNKVMRVKRQRATNEHSSLVPGSPRLNPAANPTAHPNRAGGTTVPGLIPSRSIPAVDPSRNARGGAALPAAAAAYELPSPARHTATAGTAISPPPPSLHPRARRPVALPPLRMPHAPSGASASSAPNAPGAGGGGGGVESPTSDHHPPFAQSLSDSPLAAADGDGKTEIELQPTFGVAAAGAAGAGAVRPPEAVIEVDANAEAGSRSDDDYDDDADANGDGYDDTDGAATVQPDEILEIGAALPPLKSPKPPRYLPAGALNSDAAAAARIVIAPLIFPTAAAAAAAGVTAAAVGTAASADSDDGDGGAISEHTRLSPVANDAAVLSASDPPAPPPPAPAAAAIESSSLSSSHNSGVEGTRLSGVPARDPNDRAAIAGGHQLSNSSPRNWRIRVERYSLAWWMHRIGWAMSFCAVLHYIDPLSIFGFFPYPLSLAVFHLMYVCIMLVLSTWLQFTVAVLYRRMGHNMPKWMQRAILAICPVYVILLTTLYYIPRLTTGLEKWTAPGAIIVCFTNLSYAILTPWVYFRIRAVMRAYIERRAMASESSRPIAIDYSTINTSMTSLKRFVVVVTASTSLSAVMYAAGAVAAVIQWINEPNLPDQLLIQHGGTITTILAAFNQMVGILTVRASWIPIHPIRTPSSVAAEAEAKRTGDGGAGAAPVVVAASP